MKSTDTAGPPLSWAFGEQGGVPHRGHQGALLGRGGIGGAALRRLPSLCSVPALSPLPPMPTCSWGGTLAPHIPPYYISAPPASRPTHPQEPRTRLDWSRPRTSVALIWIPWGSSAPLCWHIMRGMLCELNIFPCFFKKRDTQQPIVVCLLIVVESVHSCDGP